MGIDNNPRVMPDICHNLDAFPYPFPDSHFDRVVCFNGIEHFAYPLKVLSEVARISKPGARVTLTTPHFTSPDAYTDPTHLHAFTSRSFDYLVPDTELFDLNYSQGCFRKISVEVTFDGTNRFIRPFVQWSANRNLLRYERRWAYIAPGHQLIFEFEVMK